jgi:hypothetical protein
MTASIGTTSGGSPFGTANAAAIAAQLAARAAVASLPDRRREPLDTPAGRRLRQRLAQIHSAV